MSKDYDAVIVGARLGGASTAMLLARKGYNVLLVDRARFPSDIGHGHYVHRAGPRLLKQWGLLDKIVASGCPPVTTHILDLGQIVLTGRDLVEDGVAAGYGPRRSILDMMLIEAAIGAGAEFREGFVVDGYVREGDRIAGIRGRDVSTGTSVTEQARITIGADGRSSQLASAVDAPFYDTTPTLNAYYYSYWSGIADMGAEIYPRAGQLIIVHPTHDDLAVITVSWPIAEQQEVQAALPQRFAQAMEKVPSLAERVRAGRQEERFYGAANLPHFFRKPFGPGWALVGDAGCHTDPYTGLGCGNAMRDASFLTDALAQGFEGGPEAMDAALAGYELHRNAATLPDYRLNLSLASFAPPTEQERRLLAALADNPEETNRFFRAREGMIPPESFFNPENIARIIQAAETKPAPS